MKKTAQFKRMPVGQRLIILRVFSLIFLRTLDLNLNHIIWTYNLYIISLSSASTLKIGHFGNGWLRKISHFLNMSFQNRSLRKRVTSKMGHFENGSLRKWATSRMGKFGSWTFQKISHFDNGLRNRALAKRVTSTFYLLLILTLYTCMISMMYFII